MSETRVLEPSNCRYGQDRYTCESAPLWFAAYTTPRHEKYVSEMLTERRVETFLPLYRSARDWKKSRPVVLELPLFPSYVFVHIPRNARGTVLSMPGVISIVGSSREPWPLPDREIRALRLGMQAHRVEPHPYLRAGEKVRVKSGLMTGVEGILSRKNNELRVILAFEAIMRGVSVEVDADDLEPLVDTTQMIEEAV